MDKATRRRVIEEAAEEIAAALGGVVVRPEPRQGTQPRTHPVPADHLDSPPCAGDRYLSRDTWR